MLTMPSTIPARAFPIPAPPYCLFVSKVTIPLKMATIPAITHQGQNKKDHQ